MTRRAAQGGPLRIDGLSLGDTQPGYSIESCDNRAVRWSKIVEYLDHSGCQVANVMVALLLLAYGE
jgi:hypothetical protein